MRLVHLPEHTTGFEDIHFREYAYNNPTISLQDSPAYNPVSRTARWEPSIQPRPGSINSQKGEEGHYLETVIPYSSQKHGFSTASLCSSSTEVI